MHKEQASLQMELPFASQLSLHEGASLDNTLKQEKSCRQNGQFAAPSALKLWPHIGFAVNCANLL